MKNKQTINIKNKVLIIMTLLFIGIAFWVLNYLTPEWTDDYRYKFIFCDGISIANNSQVPRITSLGDIFISQYNHYFLINGRSIVHFIVQLFTGILGKNIFNIINTIVFLIFVYILTRLYTLITPNNLFFSLCIIFLLYPIFSECVLWLSGGINYMWTSTAICIFLYIIEQLQYKKLCKKYFIFSLPCLLVGWMHEGLTFPLAISLILYMIINYKTIYRQAIFPLIIGFTVGAFICLFAPSTMGRASFHSDKWELSTLLTRLIPIIRFCIQKLIALDLLCITIIVLFIKQKSLMWLKDFYKKNIIIFNALCLSFAWLPLIFLTARAVAGIELFAMILFLRLIQYHKISIPFKIQIAIYIISSILYSIIVYYSIDNYREYKYILSQIKNKQDTIIPINHFYPPSYIESYILKYTDGNNSNFYDYVWNRCIAATYGYDSIAFVPAIVYNDIINHSDKINDINKQKDYPFYVIPTNNSIANATPTFILRPTKFQQLPFYIRPIAHRMLRYTATEIPASQYGTIYIKGEKYLFINKYNVVDDRVKAILLKE